MVETSGTVCPHRGCPRESCHLAAQLEAHNYNNEVDADNFDAGDCDDAGDDDGNGCDGDSYGEDDEDLTCRQYFNRTSTTHYQISMAQTLTMAIMMIMLFMLSMRMKDYDGELFKYC